MRRRLQPDRRHARSGIAPSGGHFLNLFDDQVVKSSRSDLGDAEFSNAEEERQAEDDFREIIFQNDATQIELESSWSKPF